MAAVSQATDRTRSSARTQTLFALWVTYASFYLCRVNIGPAGVSIRRELGFSAVQFGLLLSAGKWGYAFGQFVNGQLTERYGPKRLLAIGMLGSSALALLMAAAPMLSQSVGGGLSSVASSLGFAAGSNHVLATMCLIALLNGAFQAGGWPPCVKIAANWYPPQQRGRVMGILGTSYTIGSAIVISLVGALLRASNDAWQIAFIAPAVLLAVSSIHTGLALRERPPHADQALASMSPHAARLPLWESLGATLKNPRVWVLAFGLFGVDAVRYFFLDWAPGHLAEVQKSSTLAAAIKTSVFPLAGAAGTLSAGWLTDRFFQSRRAPVCAMMLLALGILTISYRVVVNWGTIPTVICLALDGFSLYGAHILLVGAAAQDFARKGATAAAAGFIDCMGHVGAASADLATGSFLKAYGWGTAITAWAFTALAAAALVATLWRARPADAGPAAA